MPFHISASSFESDNHNLRGQSSPLILHQSLLIDSLHSPDTVLPLAWARNLHCDNRRRLEKGEPMCTSLEHRLAPRDSADSEVWHRAGHLDPERILVDPAYLPRSLLRCAARKS